MLNKLKFNNLIISNKKEIQRARTQCISKLVKKIKKLKSQITKRPEDNKLKTRLTRSTAVIACLKQLNQTDIVKRCLLLDKEPAKVLTNGRSMPEEIAVATLATNKVLLEILQKLKTELNLTPNDNSWKDEIMQSSKRSLRREKTEEKRRKRKELKEQKTTARKRHEWLQENNPEARKSVTTEVTRTLNMSSSGAWIEELIADEKPEVVAMPQVVENPNKELKRRADKAQEVQPMKKKTTTELAVYQHLPSSNKNSKQTAPVSSIEAETSSEEEENETPVVTKALKKPKTAEETAMNVEENTRKSAGFKSKSTDAHKTVPEKEQEPETSYQVDDFFITAEGDNYLATVPVRAADSQLEAKEQQHQKHFKQITDFKDNNFKGKQQQQARRQQQSGGAHFQNRDFNSKYNKEQQQWQPRKRNEPYQKPGNERLKHFNKKVQQQKQTPKTPNEKLHPSWAAKQKLKPVISQFQGKKIVFGEDGDNNNAGHSQQNHNNRQSSNSNLSQPPSGKSPTEVIHPSWAAKQAKKPIITAFQGKKIVFDDD